MNVPKPSSIELAFDVSILPDDTQCRDLEEVLEERLDEFNVAETGLTDGRLLGISIRDEAGEVMAGIIGHTWGQCAEWSHVWVAEQHRHRGLGRTLLEIAEAEAILRGCRQIILRTHSFQAPEFYARCGYQRAFVIHDKPGGHSDILFTKTLPVIKPA